jgi:hypothetical protein
MMAATPWSSCRLGSMAASCALAPERAPAGERLSRAVAPVVVFAATGSVLDATGSVFAATGSVFGGSPPLPPSDTSPASASPMGTSVFGFAMPGI